MKHPVPIVLLILLGCSLLAIAACQGLSASPDESSRQVADASTVLAVNPAHFTAANPHLTVRKIACTLSDGTKTDCYQLVTNSTPTDHPMGPWCPDHIEDDAAAGGIWIKDGEVYELDGKFVENLASMYGDKSWRMYDAEGNIFVTDSEQDCINAANPNVGAAYANFCVECIPSYIGSISQTYVIPARPVRLNQPISFSRGGPGPGRPAGGDRPGRGDRPARPEGPPPRADRPDRPPRPGGPGGPGRTGRPAGPDSGIPSARGIALNGVEFSAPAPLNHILAAYTIAPFDDAGGHINVHQGYHYHAATGVSFSIAQTDGHAPLIGYAMDGHGIYARLDAAGNEAGELDACRGQYDAVRGYHYHVDAAGNNNFINCLQGAYAK